MTITFRECGTRELPEGMQAAFEKAIPEPLKEVNWKNHLFDMPINKSKDNLAELVNQIKKIKPDIIHLHHLHGY